MNVDKEAAVVSGLCWANHVLAEASLARGVVRVISRHGVEESRADCCIIRESEGGESCPSYAWIKLHNNNSQPLLSQYYNKLDIYIGN